MKNYLAIPNKTMSSLEMAELTGKQHKHVLVDIRKMLSELNLMTADFSAVHKNQQGKEQPCFNLNEELSLTLVSGYNVKMRNAIIKRWHELESLSHKTELEMLLITVQKAVDHERNIKELQHQQKETTAQMKALVDGEDYFTVVGYANLTGKKVDAVAASRIGKKTTKLCKTKGWYTGSAGHPTYGHCNTYPREALEQVFLGEAA